MAIKLLISFYGYFHPDIAISYNSIGGVYNSMGQYANAL